MNLKKLAKGDKIEFHGVEIEREYRSDTLYSVTVRFVDGNFFTVAKGEYSEMHVLVKEPPKMIKKWRVKGQFYDKPFTSVFDDKYAAQTLKDSLACADLDIEEFEEPEE